MPKAIWNGAVIAESDNTVIVEGNHYFPADSINTDYLTPSAATTVCSWKGVANYYDIEVDGQVNAGGAFYYADPLPKAVDIKEHVAFWRGVTVEG